MLRMQSRAQVFSGTWGNALPRDAFPAPGDVKALAYGEGTIGTKIGRQASPSEIRFSEVSDGNRMTLREEVVVKR